MSDSKVGSYFFVDKEDETVSQTYGVNVREEFLKDRLHRTLRALESAHECTLNRQELLIKRKTARTLWKIF